MNTKIHITDLNLLKITKVRNWSIAFDYGSKHYLLHGTSELGEGSWNVLFERTYDANGKYYLKKIADSNGSEYIIGDYIPKQKGKTIIYSQINKAFFAYMLTFRNFATGIMEDKVKEVKEKQAKIQTKIQKYNQKILDLKKEYNGLEHPKF